MPRNKKKEHCHYPTGLISKKVRGVKRFMVRKIDKKEILFPKGTTESDAIDAVICYNAKYRNPIIKKLLTLDTDNKPLKDWIPHVIDRVKKEELKVNKIVDAVFATFCLDIGRLKSLHGKVLSKDLTLDHVNEYLDNYVAGKSSNVYNAKISFLSKVFDYLLDEGAMYNNPARNKKKKPKPQKERIRLNIENFKIIQANSQHHLNIAMRLALQTTHAVNEVTSLKYSDCTWFNEPKIQNELPVFGTLQILRKKVIKYKVSRVEIPITQQLKDIIEDSKKDKVLSPYIVHRRKDPRGKIGQSLTNQTQCRPEDISNAFAKTRDNLTLYNDIPMAKRPTFHEIRSLAIYLYSENGIDPQERAAHKDAKTTEIYKDGHVEWVKIQAAELTI